MLKFDVVDMFVAANAAAKKWGGRNSPTKAEIFIPAGLTSEERGRRDQVIAKFEEANGAPVKQGWRIRVFSPVFKYTYFHTGCQSRIPAAADLEYIGIRRIPSVCS